MKKWGVILTVIAMVLLILGVAITVNIIRLDSSDNQKPVYSETFEVVGNGFTKKTFSVDSGEYIVSLTLSNGSVRFTPLSSENFDSWSRGEYQPFWFDTFNNSGIGNFECTSWFSHQYYLVFWNQNSSSLQIATNVHKANSGQSYNPLSFAGISLIAVGIIIEVITILLLKHGHRIKDFWKALILSNDVFYIYFSIVLKLVEKILEKNRLLIIFSNSFHILIAVNKNAINISIGFS